MMMNALRILAVGAAGLAATGCLQGEITHTLYLTPDGAVSWVVEEKGVYSDLDDSVAREMEESGYIVSVKGEMHRMALGLAALGPDGVLKTQVVRDERPFHVVTQAHFNDIDRVMQRLFYENGIQALVTLDRSGGETALRIALDFTSEAEHRDGPASALLEQFDGYRFVLTDGTFVSGSGFDIADSRCATLAREWLKQAEQAYEDHAPMELRLAWKR